MITDNRKKREREPTSAGPGQPASGGPTDALTLALARVNRPFRVFGTDDALQVTEGPLDVPVPNADGPARAYVPACRPEDLGDPAFRAEHGLRYAYIAGVMANGSGSTEIVEAMGREGMVGFFGAAGLQPDAVESAIDRVSTRLADRPWGCNLIHSPFEPDLEEEVADLYIRRGVRLVSASAYLDARLPLVRYRVNGIGTDSQGRVVAPNRLIGKVSREEVAAKFLAPPPEKMLGELVRRGEISEEQARMASTIPLAHDLTVEADSGGHTDNRPALALLPLMLALRDRLQAQYGYAVRPRIGAAGGISTPHSAAAAFAMGADYVLTGSINQACREAGTSDVVRQMLAEARQADVAMAPAADMFEMGVKLQVLKRGTLFPMRAQKLYELYREHEGLEAIPERDREEIERSIFKTPLDEMWQEVSKFWSRRDPRQLERAEHDSKHRMALVFRWYLGMSSRWANSGDTHRKIDYQIWCGPAMGAFNEWVRGSFLEPWQNRRVVPIALNILHGACVLIRGQALRSQGVSPKEASLVQTPREPAELEEYWR